MQDPRSILITGASSGIGAALARLYAAPGVTLHLTGRDGRRLAAVAEDCRARGAAAGTAALDVLDRAAVAAWIAACDAERPLDRVIANAGIAAGTGSGGETAEQARAIIAVNLDGVLNTVLPTLPPMQQRRHGQIALMSSLASFRGFPGAPAYCASKAAVRLWGEGLRGLLARDGLSVSVICPGFIATPMTAVNPYPMPFLMSAERAATIIRRGLARDRARIAFPWPTYALSWLLGCLPPALSDGLLARLPKKP